jgi:hypothetical protein
LGYKNLTELMRIQASAAMDLEAAQDRNTKADRLTRIGMLFCFGLTGAILLGSLVIDSPTEPQAIVTSASSR